MTLTQKTYGKRLAGYTVEEQLRAAKQFIIDHETAPADRTPEEQAVISKTIAIDFDDTLFIGLWQPTNPTHEVGEPIWTNINKAKQLIEDGYHIIVYTARGWEDQERLENACKAVGLKVDRVVCGKPIAMAYVDDRALHESESEWGIRRRITQL